MLSSECVVSAVCLQAEGIVLSLRDLFQVVFDMKKREVEEAKKSQPDSVSLFSSQRLVCAAQMLVTSTLCYLPCIFQFCLIFACVFSFL